MIVIVYKRIYVYVRSQMIKIRLIIIEWRCPWCNGYRRRKWTRRHEFKSWTRLSAFHIALRWERYESNYSPSSYG